MLNQVISIAISTGKEVLKFHKNKQPIKSVIKEDQSPQTEADLIAHQMICEALKQINPILPILSEESASIEVQARRSWGKYWLVDPLDGTKEFLKGLGQFTINIALIEKDKPTLGVVYSPVDDVCYYANSQGAFKRDKLGKDISISTRKADSNNIIVVASNNEKKSSLDHLLKSIGPYSVMRMGSSLKICLVAEGKADIYPRLFPINEWDIAAAHCILLQAGGDLYLNDKTPLRYNQKQSLLIPGFIAISDHNKQWLQLLRD